MSHLDWHVGMKVVCVDDEDHGRYSPWPSVGGLDGLTVGAVYTIRKIGEYRGLLGIWLCEIARNPWAGKEEPPFSVRRFRPIQTRQTDISIFTQMLNPSKINVGEPA